ncbi:LuxR C-terminal-related transcriptional regulator [Capillimicrobium parvum]|uniref:HTH-type transcriptional regulator MalT n=1 Tax=Capillimicrobium parvum TaxID=2884022 RepID=A0A9E6Y1P4_9ACTN|nr:LuxR C-terminal-related transcriptional regulator [Capillimicrobium parvum]UGS37791.1 HTH-type transcriptional regulator MalT [Capillimicrobium parvum]
MAASTAEHRASHDEILDGFVARPRLVRTFDETRGTVIGTVVAPSGYGKTTFLRQWAHDDPRPVAWLTLRREHTARPRLLDAIAGHLAAVQQPDRSDPRVALVLDDAHVLPSDSAELLLLVAEHLPAGSLLVIASTCEPPLPMGRLRLERRLREVRACDLAMTRSEARELLHREGIRLDPDQLTKAMHATEGWPAGLVLTALAVRACGGASAALESFGGDDRVVADYLNDVFLDALPADRLQLLVRTSVLDQLTGPLCDAVANQHGSGAALREMSRANILVSSLDRCERTFRVHPLLRGLLRSELRRAGQDVEARAHARAATWFEGHGDPDSAIDQAAAAGDVDRAGRLLWASAPFHAVHGRNAYLERALRRFTPAQIAGDPALALCTATSRLGTGDRDYVEHWTDVAEHGIRDASPACRARFAAGVAVLRASVARRGLAQMSADAQRAHRLDVEDGAWRAQACFLDGAALHLTGDAPAARERLTEGVRLGALDAPVVEVQCRAQLALIDFADEQWSDAEEHAERARSTLEQSGLDEQPVGALAYAVSAFARAHNGEIEQASCDVDAAGRLLERLTGAAPWFEAEIRIALARTQLRLSDSAAARGLLTSAGRLLRHCPDATVLRAAIDDAWARADTFAAAAVVGVCALTTAELRVLRMLPSHLSLGEIAARLHVSLNTVKTQAHAVYRKLDASSRSEAVTCARTVGLIDG